MNNKEFNSYADLKYNPILMALCTLSSAMTHIDDVDMGVRLDAIAKALSFATFNGVKFESVLYLIKEENVVFSKKIADFNCFAPNCVRLVLKNKIPRIVIVGGSNAGDDIFDSWYCYSIVIGNITIAMLIVGAVQYILPYDLPQIQIPIALVFIFLFSLIAYRGMRTSAVMLVTFSVIAIFTVVAVIVPTFFKLEISNFSPFFVFPKSMIFIGWSKIIGFA